MNEPLSPSNQSQSKSLWLIKAAWISVGSIVAWALLSYFVIKQKEVSLLDLAICGVLMIGSLALFLAGFITSWISFYQNRKTSDLVLKRKLFRRVLWSLPGLLLGILLVVLLGFLFVSVAQALFTVR